MNNHYKIIILDDVTILLTLSIFTHFDFDPVLSHYTASYLYPFHFVTLNLNVFLHLFAWIDQESRQIKNQDY